VAPTITTVTLHSERFVGCHFYITPRPSIWLESSLQPHPFLCFYSIIQSSLPSFSSYFGEKHSANVRWCEYQLQTSRKDTHRITSSSPVHKSRWRRKRPWAHRNCLKTSSPIYQHTTSSPAPSVSHLAVKPSPMLHPTFERRSGRSNWRTNYRHQDTPNPLPYDPLFGLH
jgi:hypothetical protein